MNQGSPACGGKDYPKRSSFLAKEVCELTGVKPYILRYWENEFPFLSAMEMVTGEKAYDHRGLNAIELIKKWLYEDKMTIEEARMRGTLFFKEDAAEKNPLLEEETRSYRDGLLAPDKPDKVACAKIRPTPQVIAIEKGSMFEVLEHLQNVLNLTNRVIDQHHWH